MTDVIVKEVSAPAEKATAGQIQTNCPARLKQIAEEVEERFEKAQKRYQEAVNHIDAIKALMDEARQLCDDGGLQEVP
jgi:hypothetical protein